MRRRRGYRVNGFTLDDVARASQDGDLVGDKSDEPRLDADQAVQMLAASTSFTQTESVLGLVAHRDRRRVLKRADQLRAGHDNRRRRRTWRDERLPFGEEPY